MCSVTEHVTLEVRQCAFRRCLLDCRQRCEGDGLMECMRGRVECTGGQHCGSGGLQAEEATGDRNTHPFLSEHPLQSSPSCVTPAPLPAAGPANLKPFIIHADSKSFPLPLPFDERASCQRIRRACGRVECH